KASIPKADPPTTTTIEPAKEKRSERPPGTYAIWAMEVIGGTCALLYYLDLHTDYLKPTITPLTPTKYTPLKLISTTPLTPDTTRFRFETKRPRFDGELEKEADDVMAQGAWAVDVKDHLVQTYRTYTPVEYHMGTEVDEETGARTGYLDLIVKRYPRGSLSRFIHGTRVGTTVEMRGPLPVWPYKEKTYRNIYMVAGGTGIAPMYQIIHDVLLDSESTTRILLLYGSRSEEDIIMREDLDQLKEKYGDRLRIEYLVEQKQRQDKEGAGAVVVGVPDRRVLGRFTAEFNSEKDVVLVCGPGAMMNAVCGARPIAGGGINAQGPLRGALADLGFAPESVFKF
ncbi:hypothetical protein GGF37_002419, partial [Kickxella alabastrina]